MELETGISARKIVGAQRPDAYPLPIRVLNISRKFTWPEIARQRDDPQRRVKELEIFALGMEN
jgi:hypothetical protein